MILKNPSGRSVSEYENRVPPGTATNSRDPSQATGPDRLRKAVRDLVYSVISATVIAVLPRLRIVSRVLTPTAADTPPSYTISATPVRQTGSFA